MWKLFFVYSDKSKCSITGKGSDISLYLAIKYQNLYGSSDTEATYQKYPKSKNKPRPLGELIIEMEEAAKV